MNKISDFFSTVFLPTLTSEISFVLCFARTGRARGAVTPSTDVTVDVVASGRPNGVLR